MTEKVKDFFYNPSDEIVELFRKIITNICLEFNPERVPEKTTDDFLWRDDGLIEFKYDVASDIAERIYTCMMYISRERVSEGIDRSLFYEKARGLLVATKNT
ncbi:hypothetical protein ACFL2R_01895 [Patescibacteria group bacterium]